jgi:translation initiation factor IF-2
MAAAALMAGALLIGTPFVIASLLPGDDSPERRPGAAGYADRAAGAGGYVPSAAAETPGASHRPAARNGEDATGRGEDGTGPGDPDGGTGPKGAEGAAVTDGEEATDDTAGSGPTAGTDRGATSGPTGDGGARTSSGRGSGTPATATARATQKAAGPATYSAVGGPHCSGDVTYRESGSSSEGDDGWTTHPGGYSDGCTGVFRSLPISGSSSDAGNSAYWIFRTGDVVRGTCKVSVHIPNDSKRTHVGGTPAYYTLHNATNGATNLLANFTIDQPSHQGMWVAASSVRVTEGILTLKLHDRGKEATSGARMAADAARINCTAS